MSETGWSDRARELYHRAQFGGGASALAAAERELDAAEADLALARGRLLHTRFLAGGEEDERELALFERAIELYREQGDIRGEAEALFWAGTFHQVVRQDPAAARPFLDRSHKLAAEADDKLTLSYAVRHLGFAELGAGNIGSARAHLTESLRLRREIGFTPGVAAALLALAELEAEDGDREAARALLDEAVSVARSCDAGQVLSWAAEARAKM